jgi:methyl-accepting chemotaxis protein
MKIILNLQNWKLAKKERKVFKNMKLGLKMGLGFGLVIVLVIVVGGIAILNMLDIQKSSISLDSEYVPEVGIANNVERNSFLTMYGMRGYSLSFDEDYWQSSQESYKLVGKYLQEAKALAEKHPDLTALKEGTQAASSKAEEYGNLADSTREVILSILVNRQDLDTSSTEFMDAANTYLKGQNTKFTQNITDGLGSNALMLRLQKITLINDVIDLGNALRIANWNGQLNRDAPIMESALNNFKEVNSKLIELRGITTQTVDLKDLDEIETSGNQYSSHMSDIIEAYTELAKLSTERGAAANEVLSAAQDVAAKGITTTQGIAKEAVNTVSSAVIVIIIGLITALIIAVIIAVFLTITITSALKKGLDFAMNISRGNLLTTIDLNQKDELGVLADALKNMQSELLYKDEMLGKISEGNLTENIRTSSNEDTLGESLVKMSESFNSLLGNVNMSVDQVNIGADQVSQASQSLSQGATESAASLEEVSASVTQINSQSKQNAENATEANGIAKQANEDAEKGNKQMATLSEAMGKINTSSDQIKKIVKVIDDIAFQTNLLALNANVEAARAGKYGKGFAVVADEVRNLAVRSAEAVKETTVMVDDSIKNIEEGNKAVEATAIQLESISKGSSKVADFLEEIATASKEQAEAIDQITQGLEQIDQVTQSNTASAEESAAAAEELASQSVQLKNMVATIKLKHTQNTSFGQPSQLEYQAPQRALPSKEHNSDLTSSTGVKPVDPASVIALDDEDFDRF